MICKLISLTSILLILTKFYIMKKLILSCATLVVMFSCNQSKTSDSKSVTVGNDTVADVDIAITKLDQIAEIADDSHETVAKPHQLLFTAHGSEPGWFAQFYNDKLRLLVDYGKDSVLIDDVFEKLDDTNGFKYVKAVSENEKKYSLAISIENVSCISEASGDKEDRKVTVKYNNKTYKGCGSFVK